MKFYQTKEGDTLPDIALRYNTTPEMIADDNQLNVNNIVPGQILIIRSEEKRKIIVNGYIYPNINIDVLYASLPFLSFLSIFSYHITEEGNLMSLNDNTLIKMALDQEVAPFVSITNMNENGFDTELIHKVLNDDNIQNNLIENILNLINSKNYYGVNIDFEYIMPNDKEQYNNFIRKISKILHSNNYLLSTSLAPKTYKNQPGTLYEAHDYSLHGRYADFIILMTYEWGYSYGPPMAVAPLNKIEQVLEYAITEIPSHKILMGIPNYGYDWNLPYIKGTRAKSLSNSVAIQLAMAKKAPIEFDDTAMTPYFHYYDENGEHVVWFEDARSIEAKLNLVNKYNLGGVSYWNINNIFNQNYLVLDSMFNITKVV